MLLVKDMRCDGDDSSSLEDIPDISVYFRVDYEQTTITYKLRQ